MVSYLGLQSWTRVPLYHGFWSRVENRFRWNYKSRIGLVTSFPYIFMSLDFAINLCRMTKVCPLRFISFKKCFSGKTKNHDVVMKLLKKKKLINNNKALLFRVAVPDISMLDPDQFSFFLQSDPGPFQGSTPPVSATMHCSISLIYNSYWFLYRKKNPDPGFFCASIKDTVFSNGRIRTKICILWRLDPNSTRIRNFAINAAINKVQFKPGA